MADNLTTQSATPATVPASTVIATDDAGAGGHVQIVKLAIGTDGSATVIPADATNGLDVDVTRLPALPAGTNNIGDVDVASIAAGTNTIGKVRLVDADGDEISVVAGVLQTSGAGGGGGAVTVDQSQTSAGLTTATTAYTLGDTLGNGWTFTSMATAAGGHGAVTGISCIDESDVMEGMVLWFTRASVTFGTDNAAPSISDADAAKIVAGPVSVPFTDLGGVRAGSIADRIPYVCDATSLFVYATTLSANAVFGAGVGSLKLTLLYEVQD